MKIFAVAQAEVFEDWDLLLLLWFLVPSAMLDAFFRFSQKQKKLFLIDSLKLLMMCIISMKVVRFSMTNPRFHREITKGLNWKGLFTDFDQMGKGKDTNDGGKGVKSGSGVRYYLATDVVIHNKPDDCWVSFLGKVCNVTPLIKEFNGQKSVKPLLAYAGKDISHWFDKRTQDIKYMIHPVTGLRVPYCPHGPIPHVPPQVPLSTWQPIEAIQRPYDGMPWWRDKKYVIGLLSLNPRPVRVINTVVPQSHRHSLAWVAAEEKLYQILERLLPRNSHVNSYTCKFEGENLKMDKTLEENMIPDERRRFSQLGMRDNCYIPAIQLYFNDDLTL